VDPDRVTICHCTDCQSLTGSAYRVSVPTLAGDFHMLRGTPATYVKTGESGAKRVHGFCATCGSPIYSRAMDNPTTYGLRVGGMEERRELPARKQIWCRSALGWTANIAGLPGREKE
jgi:hypothetical protein